MQVLAKGKSMLPTLVDGRLYKAIKVETAEKIAVGDIIAFSVDNMVICHRVKKIIQSKNGKVYYKTQGDNCQNADNFAITFDMVLCKIDM